MPTTKDNITFSKEDYFQLNCGRTEKVDRVFSLFLMVTWTGDRDWDRLFERFHRLFIIILCLTASLIRETWADCTLIRFLSIACPMLFISSNLPCSSYRQNSPYSGMNLTGHILEASR